MTATIPDSHRDLLDRDVAVLATVGRDGYPQVTALWFLADEQGTIRLSLNTARQKTKNLRAHPECTLFFLDRANPYRTLEIRARAELSPDDGYAFAGRLGRKYSADLRTMDRQGERRVVVTLRPEHVVAINLGGWRPGSSEPGARDE
jgi:PPOX class probable F420-dependent enzyme